MKNRFVKLVCIGAMFLAPVVARAQGIQEMTDQGIEAVKSGDYDLAISFFSGALKLNVGDSGSEAIYFNRGLAYAAKGDHDAAIKDFNDAIRLSPQFAMAYDSRGHVHDQMGDHDKAFADYSQAIAVDPKFARAWFDRGAAYGIQGDLAKALADFDGAIQADPKYVMAYNNRGFVHQRQGDYAKAVADYSKAVELNPKFAGALNQLAWLLATCPQAGIRDGKKAVDYAQQACELSEWKAAPAIQTLAAACAESGDFPNAVKYAEQYLATPGLPAKSIAQGKEKLALYKAGKPYHEAKK